MRVALWNLTQWDDRALLELLHAGFAAHRLDDSCDVVVRYRPRGSTLCGRAAVGGRWMELRLPRSGEGPELEARRLTSILDHEIMHLRGYDHEHFPDYARWCHDRGAPWHPKGARLLLRGAREGTGARLRRTSDNARGRMTARKIETT